MFIDKDTFFAERKLPVKTFYYRYEGKIYDLPADYLIDTIKVQDKEVARCLYIMNELNASDEFIVDVYLQGIADEVMARYVKGMMVDDIAERVRRGERVTLNLKYDDGKTSEYVAYKDNEDRYHICLSNKALTTVSRGNYSKFSDRLAVRINESIVDNFERVEEAEISK